MENQCEVVWPGWTTVRKIGTGSFGSVYEIQRDVFGEIEKAALKVISIPKDPSEADDLRSEGYDHGSIVKHYQNYLEEIVREYSLMTRLKGHEYIVYCDDIRYIQHEDDIGWDVFIKMELLTPLMRTLPSFRDERSIITLGINICKALVVCNDANIIHRDIKPQNIFVTDDGRCKLGDFGIAKISEHTSGGTKVGTFKYMAPEVYNHQPYGASSDIYSLGMVLYWLLNEYRTPFLPLPPEVPTVSLEELARQRRFSGEVLPKPREGSEGLHRIVLKACAFEPKERYQSAREMLRDLQALREAMPTAEDLPRRRGEELPKNAAVEDEAGPVADGTIGVLGRAPVAVAESDDVAVHELPVEEPSAESVNDVDNICQRQPDVGQGESPSTVETAEEMTVSLREREKTQEKPAVSPTPVADEKQEYDIERVEVAPIPHSDDNGMEVDESEVAEVTPEIAPEHPSESQTIGKDKRRTKWWLWAVAGVLIIGVIVGVTLMPQLCRESQYQDAISLYNSGKYNKAKEIFADLGDYSDSANMIKACDYGIANVYLLSGNYSEARIRFQKLGTYSNAASKVLECDYGIAIELLETEDYEGAKKLFEALGNYSDSSDRVLECDYGIATELLEKKDYEGAQKAFEALGSYSYAPGLALSCAQRTATTLMYKGEYEKAVEIYLSFARYLDSGNYANIKGRAEICYLELVYGAVNALMDTGEYEKAKEICLALGDYILPGFYADTSHIKERAIVCYFELAHLFLQNDDLESAAELMFLAGRVLYESEWDWLEIVSGYVYIFDKDSYKSPDPQLYFSVQLALVIEIDFNAQGEIIEWRIYDHAAGGWVDSDNAAFRYPG